MLQLLSFQSIFKMSIWHLHLINLFDEAFFFATLRATAITLVLFNWLHKKKYRMKSYKSFMWLTMWNNQIEYEKYECDQNAITSRNQFFIHWIGFFFCLTIIIYIWNILQRKEWKCKKKWFFSWKEKRNTLKSNIDLLWYCLKYIKRLHFNQDN